MWEHLWIPICNTLLELKCNLKGKMKIQKIIDGRAYEKVIEYDINTEKMKSLPHTFRNFLDENDFHSAFFDKNHPKHAEAYEILEHVLKPEIIYENRLVPSNEFWASGNDLRKPIGEPIFVNDRPFMQKMDTVEEVPEHQHDHQHVEVSGHHHDHHGHHHDHQHVHPPQDTQDTSPNQPWLQSGGSGFHM